MRAWRQRLGLTQTQVGEALDLTLRAIQHYEGGTRSIPRVVELACWAVEQGRISPSSRVASTSA
jgi:transcriptional regulator with XRE-family HTH domain